MEIIPNWHPLVVHFSVALLVTATILLSWGTIKGRLSQEDTLISAGRLILWLGLLAIAATVAAGLQAYYSVDHDSPSHLAMTNHRNWAFGSLAAFLIVGIVMWRARKSDVSVLHVGALVISTGLLLSTAYKGGDLVYKYGLGVQSLPVVSGVGNNHKHAESEEHGDIPTQDKVTGKNSHEHAEGEAHNDVGSTHDNQSALDFAKSFHAALFGGDFDVVAQSFSPDAVIFENGVREKSLEDYLEHHLKPEMPMLKASERQILQQDVLTSADAVTISTASNISMTAKGKVYDFLSVETMVLSNQADGWKVTHIHWSSRPAKK